MQKYVSSTLLEIYSFAGKKSPHSQVFFKDFDKLLTGSLEGVCQSARLKQPLFNHFDLHNCTLNSILLGEGKFNPNAQTTLHRF